jgi:hypothetical protein
VSGKAAEVLAKIRTRGYWRTLVRPLPYQKQRIDDIGELEPILRRACVQAGGWEFPVIDAGEAIRKDLDFVEHWVDWEHHIEVFRFFQSGQFALYRGFPEDWRDDSGLWPPGSKWKAGAWIGIGATVFQYTQAFEFGARLAATAAGSERLSMTVEMNGLEGRQFYVDSQRRFDSGASRTASIPSYPFALELSRVELMANARQYALQALDGLFKRVTHRPSLEILKSWQDKFGE